MKGRELAVRVRARSHECNATHLHVSDLQHAESKAAQVNTHRQVFTEALSTIVTFEQIQILNMTPLYL